MNRFASIAIAALLLGGCAADFTEEPAPGEEPTNAPASSEQTNGDPTVNVYGGHLQRPADTIGTVDQAVTTAHSRAIRNYVGQVDQAEMELPPKFNRSMSQ